MLLEYFDFNLDLDPIMIQKLLLSIGIIVAAYFVAFSIIKLINSKVDDFKKRHRARRYTYYVIIFITLIMIAFIWIKRPTSLTTFFGFLSAGLALSLHQVLLNIAGWLLIIIRSPFELGDRIEWGDVQGDVIDIRVFYTTLLEVGNWVEADQSTGRMVHVSNSNIFQEALFNSTQGFEYLWNELDFLITFESDWEKAREIILEIANQEREDVEDRARSQIKKMAKRYMIKYTKFTPITYVDIRENGVEITLRYLTSARCRRMIKNSILEEILKRFKNESDINFAYQTRRIYRRDED